MLSKNGITFQPSKKKLFHIKVWGYLNFLEHALFLTLLAEMERYEETADLRQDKYEVAGQILKMETVQSDWSCSTSCRCTFLLLSLFCTNRRFYHRVMFQSNTGTFVNILSDIIRLILVSTGSSSVF